MVAVKEITWEEASAPGFEQTTRQAWREAVAEIADKAKAKLPEWGSRRYQQKIFGKRYSDEITAGRQKRLHPEKQYVLLDVASYAERDVTVLDSKTSRVTPG